MVIEYLSSTAVDVAEAFSDDQGARGEGFFQDSRRKHRCHCPAVESIAASLNKFKDKGDRKQAVKKSSNTT